MEICETRDTHTFENPPQLLVKSNGKASFSPGGRREDNERALVHIDQNMHLF